MNIQKVHTVMQIIDKEFLEHKIIPLLQNLQATLNNSLAQRTPQAAQAFEDAKKQMFDALARCPSNSFVPSKQYIFKAIGGDVNTGNKLGERISEVVGANALTPGKAVEELQKLLNDVNAFYTAIKAVLTNFKKLNISSDALAPGSCEIGVLMPIEPELQNFEKELHELNHHLRTFSEVVSGKAEPVIIRAVSSGSPIEVFLDSAPVVALTIATTIERIVALYKNALEIRIAKKKLEDLSVPKATVASIEQHEKSMVAAELEKIADDIYKDYKGKDSGRKNELRTALSKALKYLAEKIDKGVDFEVSASENDDSEPPNEEDEVKETPAQREVKESLTLINEKGAALRMIEKRVQGVLFIQHDGKKGDEEKSKS